MSQGSDIQAEVQVQVEATPNPATVKFVFSKQISEQSAEFSSAQDTDRSPLAAKLFGFPWTQSVYIAPEFVSVTKQDWVDWDVLAEPLAGLLREHIEAGLPVLFDKAESSSAAGDDILETDSEIVKQIKRTLRNEIRPVVAMDGGDVLFANYENNTLYLHMKGACAGCPSKSITLKEGIEVRFKELYPEIKEVVAL